MMVIEQLEVPIVQAPLAGGPSTVELAVAVSEAGGLGFLAGGYTTPEALRASIARTRSMTGRPFGVNIFVPGRGPADPDAVRRYTDRLQPEVARAGVALGEPRFDDDHYATKLALLRDEAPAAVSFTFGCPESAIIHDLQRRGCAVWVTVTGPGEAGRAVEAGADALVVQGIEAGGHRGGFDDREDREDYGLLALLQLVRARVDVPLVAAGGIATGAAIAAVLAAGAAAAALGTVFLRCPEAATSAPHRAALATAQPTGLTRAFTGRLARGIVNRLQTEYSAEAPRAYPEVHYLTAPLRAHGRASGDPDVFNLWAGQTHALGQDVPAGELVTRLMDEARSAVDSVHRRLARDPDGKAQTGGAGHRDRDASGRR